MSFVAVAIGGSALLGVGSSLISANAAKGAAKSQANAENNALGIQQNEWNQIMGLEQPYIGAGNQGLGALGQYLGTNPYNGSVGSNAYGSLLKPFTADMMKQYSPAYQFQREQGQIGTLAGSSANQGALSGAAQQNLMSYNQGLANTAFNNAFNQYQTQQGNIYQRLAGLANLGQSAVGTAAGTGTSLAQSMGQTASNIGTAQAGGTVGAANAYSSGLSNMGNLGMVYAMMGNGNPANAAANAAGYGGSGALMPAAGGYAENLP